MSGAEERPQQQGSGDDDGAEVDAVERRVDRVEDDHLTGGVDARDEDDADAQQHELDPPANGPHRRAKRPLEIQHHADRAEQIKRIKHDATPLQAEEVRRVCHRSAARQRHQRGAERNQAEPGQDDRTGERGGGAGQALPAIAARVGEAEQQPDHRDERLGEQPALLPFLGQPEIVRVATEPGQERLGREHSHARREGPARQRATRPHRGAEGKSGRARGSQKREKYDE